MQSIFERMRWPWPHGSLHVYALPDAALKEQLAPFRAACDAVPFCAGQPPEWLHATVTRFAWFTADPTIPPIAAITAAVAGAAAAVAPFTVELGEPEIGRWGVLVAGSACPGWDALVDGMRKAALALDPGRELPRRPYAPHVSIGYGVADGDGELLAAPLAAMPAPGPLYLRVAEVHLLAVHQDPDAGVYRWDPLAVLPLGGLAG